MEWIRFLEIILDRIYRIYRMLKKLYFYQFLEETDKNHSTYGGNGE
jgi:hypothetical protein